MFEIPDEELRLEDIPGPDAPWHPTIAEFALTFDGYEAMGNRIYRYAERRCERLRGRRRNICSRRARGRRSVVGAA